MDRAITWLRHEFYAGWQMWEAVYVAVCTISIAVIAAYLGDNFLGIASAVTGTLYTMFAGKGKISCYVFGIFNTIVYGYIARSQTLYGDMILNWFIYLPMMFAGIVMWNRHRDSSGCVIKTRLSVRSRLIWSIAIIGGTVVLGRILQNMGDKQPLVDAATTVLSVSAIILTLKRCIEQWLLWTLVNALSVIMWLKVYLTAGNSIATLLWWSIMLITGILFFIQWLLALKSPENRELQ